MGRLHRNRGRSGRRHFDVDDPGVCGSKQYVGYVVGLDNARRAGRDADADRDCDARATATPTPQPSATPTPRPLRPRRRGNLRRRQRSIGAQERYPRAYRRRSTAPAFDVTAVAALRTRSRWSMGHLPPGLYGSVRLWRDYGNRDHGRDLVSDYTSDRRLGKPGAQDISLTVKESPPRTVRGRCSARSRKQIS